MAYLILMANGEELDRHELTAAVEIGRSSECAISVRDILMSRRHCRLEPCRCGWKVVDLCSKNGTRVGWTKVRHQVLHDGQDLRLGRTVVRFYAGAYVPPPPGTVKKDRIVRPANPQEALCGTVAGFVVDDEQQSDEHFDESALTADSPAPRPRPWDPAGYQDSGVQSLLLDLAQRRQEATAPPALRRRLPRVVIHPNPDGATHDSESALCLQVFPSPQESIMQANSFRSRGGVQVALALSLIVVLAGILFTLCGWLVIPPG